MASPRTQKRVQLSSVRSYLRSSLLALAGLLMLPALRGQVTVAHEYLFDQSLADSAGDLTLTSHGGELRPAGGYAFGANQGLSGNFAEVADGTFSIELLFSFTSLSGYRKITDFKSLSTDSGFYTLGDDVNFYPVATSTSSLVENAPIHLLLTRDAASQLVTIYLAGVQVLSFTDSSNLALTNASGTLHFFRDDGATSFSEASAGTVSLLRIFDSTLSGTDASALAAGTLALAVPEPSTWALLGLGGVAWMVTLRRRR